MANYHNNNWIIQNIKEHLEESQKYFPTNNIVGIFCQGSQNYELDTEFSDVDTKLIVTPSFQDIAMGKPSISTTHVRDNNEHIDFKDIRLYFSTFRKQNLNFLEILFTKYAIFNPSYSAEWVKLIDAREDIAHMNPYRAVKSMKGIAMEKYHAMEHPYPSKIELINQYGYDGKQVSHLLRVEDYIERYINEEPYEDCLIPTLSKRQAILDYKLQLIPLEQAREDAEKSINHIIKIADNFCDKNQEAENEEIKELLDTVQYNIMKISVSEELK